MSMRIDRVDVSAQPFTAVRAAPVTPPPAPRAAPAARVIAPAQDRNAQNGAPANDQVREQFISAARQLRDALGPMATTQPRFHAEPGTDEVMVEIVDQTSGEVVRRIPEETLLRFAESWDAYLGTLVDKEA